jgi:amino acid transporter
MPKGETRSGTDSAGASGLLSPDEEIRRDGPFASLKRWVVGSPRDPRDPTVFHKISLMAFLAWVGLGADGLSSSSYGPDEAFRAVLEHRYLAFYLALMTAVTVAIISACYAKVVEHFPSGGGGYAVATKLLGPVPGVVSGSALVVDYVLTITVSVASGVDALLSFMPLSWQPAKVPLDLAILGLLVLLNLRGVKESIKFLLPIFLVFVATHALLIVWGVLAHAGALPEIFHSIHADLGRDSAELGVWVVLLLLFRAYSLGAGTYTGIEAVANGMPLLREPRVETGKRTMLYMAISLAFTAAGILLCYLLWNAEPEAGKTMNAVLLGRVMGTWSIGGWDFGAWLVVVTLISEGALLFVAAQAGFIGGPRILSNMALDSWVPHRFANLSERLVTQNGVLLVAAAAAVLLVYTEGSVSFLVVLYSINVFLTFSLTQAGMGRFWIARRREERGWWRGLALHTVGFLLCASVLVIVTLVKFKEGGWLTFAITTTLIGVCFLVQRHYSAVRREIAKLDEILDEIPAEPGEVTDAKPDPERPVAALLVSGYGGLGVHSLLSVQQLFPMHYRDVLFVSVGRVDTGHFKGKAEVEALVASTEASLDRYVRLAWRLGLRAGSRYTIGTDVVRDSETLCREIRSEYPKAVFFLGKLVFAQDKLSYRFLHNDTANSIQRRLQFSGIQTMILPIRIRLSERFV